MCGIVGVIPLKVEGMELDEKTRRMIALYIHNETLYWTVDRGRDATGIAVSFGPLPEGVVPDDAEEEVPLNWWGIIKQPVPTEEFFGNDGDDKVRYHGQDENANIRRYVQGIKRMKRPLNHIIGHARKGTVGSEFNPLNNHPIHVGNIIGVHNGGIQNHRKIFEKHPEMKRLGDVDSEAVFQLLALHSNDRALDKESMEFVCQRIDGPRAVIAYNREHPEKVVFFRDKDRPLELAYISPVGLMVLCSERKFLEEALKSYQRMRMFLGGNKMPKLSVEWKLLSEDEGAVIDITQPVDFTKQVYNRIELLKTPKVLTDYTYGSATTGTPKSYTTPGVGVRTGSVTTPVDRTVGAGSSLGTHQGPVRALNQLGNGATQAKSEVVDMSLYEEEESGEIIINADSEDEVTAVISRVDDNEVSDKSDDPLLNSPSDDNLREMAFQYVMQLDEASETAKKMLTGMSVEALKNELDFHGLQDAQFLDILKDVYPHAFADGLVIGFRQGEAIAKLGSSDEDDVEEVEALEKELEKEKRQNALLKKEIVNSKSAMMRAGAIIANMKTFSMFFAIMSDTITVDKENMKMALSPELEKALLSVKGFNKENIEMFIDMFKDKDLEKICNNKKKRAEKNMRVSKA